MKMNTFDINLIKPVYDNSGRASEKTICFHEAAHECMRHALGIPNTKVQVSMDDSNKIVSGFSSGSGKGIFFLDEIFILSAGFAYELLFDHPENDEDSDYEVFLSIKELSEIKNTDCYHIWKYLEVDRLYSKLPDSSDGGEIITYVLTLFKRAWEILKEYASAIYQIGSELYEKHSIQGTRIKEIIELNIQT